MSCQTTRLAAAEALPIFAQLYGAEEEALAEVVAELDPIWQASREGAVAGAVGLRPATANGSEIMGGAFPVDGQDEAALNLLQAALAAQPRLYAYAEDHLLPAKALQQAGFRAVSAYMKAVGPLPTERPGALHGYTLKPLAQVSDLQERLTAQETYADQIGHTPTTEQAVQPGAGGSDETLGWLAYDDTGEAVGIMRVWRDAETISMSTPGVHPRHRATGLRRALILSACQSAHQAGASQLVLESWGDTEEQRQEDLSLGLTQEILTPIYQS